MHAGRSPFLPPSRVWGSRPARNCGGKRAGKARPVPALALQSAPASTPHRMGSGGSGLRAALRPSASGEGGSWVKKRSQGSGSARVPVRTEEAVVLPGALHAAVGQDLQVEAGAAVELPTAQDAVQVRQLRSPRPAADAPLRRAPALAQ